MVYAVYIEKGEDFGYVAHCPSIPGCHTQGDTLESTIENARDAIRGCIEALGVELITPKKDALLVEIQV